MMSPVSNKTENCFLFYKEHRNAILIIFAQSKELKFSSAYKSCFRTKKEFSIKNYSKHSRKWTSAVALCEWETCLKHYFITTSEMMSIYGVFEEFLIFFFQVLILLWYFVVGRCCKDKSGFQLFACALYSVHFILEKTDQVPAKW